MIGVLILGIIFVFGPVARSIARAIDRVGHPAVGGGPPSSEVQKALAVAEQRLSESEARLAALEDRVDFYERLLQAPKATSSSPPAPPSLPS